LGNGVQVSCTLDDDGQPVSPAPASLASVALSVVVDVSATDVSGVVVDESGTVVVVSVDASTTGLFGAGLLLSELQPTAAADPAKARRRVPARHKV
jgi:hypothetical protein